MSINLSKFYLVVYLSPHAEHVLDWFHVAMRITQMRQKAKRLPALSHDFLNPEQIDRDVESIKWYLWHGNTFNALQKIRWLDEDVSSIELEETSNPERYTRFTKLLSEFHTYIENNRSFIPNYGEMVSLRRVHFHGIC